MRYAGRAIVLLVARRQDEQEEGVRNDAVTYDNLLNCVCAVVS